MRRVIEKEGKRVRKIRKTWTGSEGIIPYCHNFNAMPLSLLSLSLSFKTKSQSINYLCVSTSVFHGMGVTYTCIYILSTLPTRLFISCTIMKLFTCFNISMLSLFYFFKTQTYLTQTLETRTFLPTQKERGRGDKGNWRAGEVQSQSRNIRNSHR